MLRAYRKWLVLPVGLIAAMMLLSCTQPVLQQEAERAAIATESPSVSPTEVYSPPTAAATVQSAETVVAATPEIQPSPTASEAEPPPAKSLEPHAGLPLSQFYTDDFVGSGLCASCHSFLSDEEGRDVSIDSHWRSAMMANAARDPVWQAKVSSEVLRRPDLQAIIEDKCATCHMPMAYTQSEVFGLPVAVLGEGLLDPDHPLHDAAMDGVSCALCHQIAETGLGESETFGGQFQIDTSTEPPGRLAYGPFPEPFQMPMMHMSGYTPLQGLHIKDAALCATCHTLFTPVIDDEGNVVGEFPEQTPYLEWQNSVFGDSQGGGVACQVCHMPAASGAVRISNHPPGRMIEARSPFAQHFFVGGNATVLSLLQSNVQDLGLTASTGLLQDTLDRTLNQLQTMTAQLSIVGKELEGSTLAVALQVDSRVGHKLPTGYPARQVWLHVTVADQSGQVLFESGRPQPDGRISGNDADEDAAAFEPHYDVISSDDQVQIYEAVMGDGEGQVTHTLFRAQGYVKDNRLLPAGFDPASASDDIAVLGLATGDETFVGGSDSVLYEIDVEGFDGPLTISAELLYQSLSYRFIEDLRGDSTEVVDHFTALYDGTEKQPVALAAVQKIIDGSAP